MFEHVFAPRSRFFLLSLPLSVAFSCASALGADVFMVRIPVRVARRRAQTAEHN